MAYVRISFRVLGGPLDASLIIVALVALALGALIGWLFGSRSGAAARRRSSNRSGCSSTECARSATSIAAAAQELAALKAAQGEREKAFGEQMEDLARSQGGADHAIPRNRRPAAGRGAQGFPRARRRALQRGRREAEEKLKNLLEPVETTLKRYEEGLQRSRRSGSTIMPGCAKRSSWSARGRGRCATRPATSSMRCAPRPRRAAAGASRASRTCSSRPGSAPMPISDPKCRSIATTGGFGPT